MKKILFGSAAALCAVVGLSAFKATKFTSYYWFKTATNYASGTNPLSVLNSDLNGYYAFTATPGDPCAQTGSNDCLIGFNANQVTPTHTGSSIYKLITSAILSQNAQANSSTRP